MKRTTFPLFRRSRSGWGTLGLQVAGNCTIGALLSCGTARESSRGLQSAKFRTGVRLQRKESRGGAGKERVLRIEGMRWPRIATLPRENSARGGNGDAEFFEFGAGAAVFFGAGVAS